MAGDGQKQFQPAGDIAMQDLAVIDVELQPQIGQLQVIDQPFRQTEVVHQIAGNIAAIDRLDQNLDAMGRGRLAGEFQRVPIGGNRRLSPWAMPAIRCRRGVPVARA